jgi:hypothetical protein
MNDDGIQSLTNIGVDSVARAAAQAVTVLASQVAAPVTRRVATTEG